MRLVSSKIDRFMLIDDYDYTLKLYIVLDKKVNKYLIEDAINDFKIEHEEYITRDVIDMLDNNFGVKEYFYIDNVLYM